MKLFIPLFILTCGIFAQLEDRGDKTNHWPKEGPPVVIEISGLGNGYSSPFISEDKLFVTGEVDGNGFLYCFDLSGNLLWQKMYGEEWTKSFPGSRAFPYLHEDKVYVCSGFGKVVCCNTNDGSLVWTLDLTADFDGINVTYGYSMPLFIFRNMIYFSPGGENHNIIALDKNTGELIWSSPAEKETAGYGAPLIINLDNRDLLVTSSEFHILGLDANSGELLWTYELAFKGELPCNKPVYDGKNLYWVAGPGNGGVAVTLSKDGTETDILWKNLKFNTFFGNFIHLDDYLYGFSESLRGLVSVDTRNGKIKNSLSFGVGSVLKYQDNIIVYNQRGQVALINPNRGKPELKSTFKIDFGSGEHFCHPVISSGMMFIRHGNEMRAYKL